MIAFSQVVKSGRKWYKVERGETIMLIGEYEHSIDAKGRLSMPAKLKSDIGEKFVVTKGLEGCLFAYSLTEWQNFEEKLREFPLTNKNARALTRFFLAGATECEIDKQGRFLISANLREYAGLEKDVVIIGVLGRLEIWDKKKWKEYNNKENNSVEDIAESLAELGI